MPSSDRMIATFSSGTGHIARQTDTNAVCGTAVGCSGGTIASSPQGKLATKGAAAGSTEVGITISPNSTQAGLMFEIAPSANTWQAGTYAVRMNLTTGSLFMGCTISAVYVCRFNSACSSQETVGSSTGLSVSVDSGNEGVKTINVTGSAVAALLTDKVYIVVLFTKTGSLNGAPGFTPDQNIDTPILA